MSGNNHWITEKKSISQNVQPFDIIFVYIVFKLNINFNKCTILNEQTSLDLKFDLLAVSEATGSELVFVWVWVIVWGVSSWCIVSGLCVSNKFVYWLLVDWLYRNFPNRKLEWAFKFEVSASISAHAYYLACFVCSYFCACVHICE